MKKSEAIVAIANKMLELAPDHYNQMGSYARRGDAEAILNVMLGLGMKAPQHHVDPETGKVYPLKMPGCLTLDYFEVED